MESTVLTGLVQHASSLLPVIDIGLTSDYILWQIFFTCMYLSSIKIDRIHLLPPTMQKLWGGRFTGETDPL